MIKVLVINGPNLNLLGTREPQVYGSQTLEMINESLSEVAQKHAIELHFLQSNAEHELIDRVHLAAQQSVDYMIVNPAAFTHTSVALRDAIAAVELPFIEVHLSNVHAREEFRSHSWFSDIAIGTITGLGSEGYLAALRYIAQLNHSNTN